MPLLTWLAYLVVGLGAGLAGSVTGVASLVAYPSLVGLGLAPVSANVTATLANVWGGIGSSWGSRPELAGQGRAVARLAAVCGAGGLLGGVLLLATPAHTFELAVPVLIAGAAGAILLRPRPTTGPDGSGPAPALRTGGVPTGLTVTAFAIAVYGGYFGAAAGVLMLATVLLTTRAPVPDATAVKNVVMAAANGVAAVFFALTGPVRWAAVLPLSLGFLLGGRLGPEIVRRMPARPLRAAIAAAGFGLAAYLAVRTY